MIDYFKRRLDELHRLLTAGETKEEHEKTFRHHFDRGKALSDFIGMIVRYVFANFAWVYFFRRVNETEGIRSLAFGMCYVFAIGVTLVLGVRIYFLIFLYETRDLYVQTNTAVKITLLIIATLISFALWYGIIDLVSSLGNKVGTVAK